jgi:hypothetical protein
MAEGPVSAEDYEKLGRQLESVLVTDYIHMLHSTRRQVWSSFIRGVFAGVGGVIGATVGVAVLLFLLQQFGAHLPFVGHFFQQLGETIKR